MSDRMELLTPSSDIVDMNLKIIHTECRRESLLIAFKGERKGGCEPDYHILQQEIQRVFKGRDNVDIGGSCFVEDKEGNWFRGKVLEKKGHFFETFLIDTGQVVMVEEVHVASACDKFFQLPPMIVCGIFANIVPLREKWSPKAINYFSSLVGLEVTGHVEAVTSYQLFILEVPKIISDVLELNLGKLADRDSFRLIVEMLRVFPPQFRTLPQFLQQKLSVQELLSFSNPEKPSDSSWLFSDVLFPNLPADSRVSVKITTAESPSKFYCQIQKWQKELENLTEAMCLYYEDISTRSNTFSDSLGQFCAAKRKNGQWHRGVIRQLLPDLSVKVWFMDFGNIEAVPSSCVKKLLAEFMSLPMISFPCALSCFGNDDKAVIKLQLKRFIQALAGQNSVCIYVNSFDASDHLYYITLPGENFGINTEHPEKLNEGAALCVSPLETKITNIGVSCRAHAVCFTRSSHKSCESFAGNRQTKNCLPEWGESLSSHCKRVEMQMNSHHAAFVVYVINPSNFWIQMCAYQNEFQALTENIADVYNQCGAEERVLKNPEPGLLCCARYSKDGHYYRGIVTEVLDVNVTVYFLDFGNTDLVPSYDVKTLLPEFSSLPALAMCCELACAFPVDDMWVKKENDFFKEVVSNRVLLFQVIGKHGNKYTVNALYNIASQKCSVAALMVQAGYAEYWERRSDSALNVSKKFRARNQSRSRQKHVNALCASKTYKNSTSRSRQVVQKEKTVSMPSVLRKSVTRSLFGKDVLSEGRKPEPEEKIHYKEFVFKPGAVFEVVCSYSVSPADFSCQLQNKLPELDSLMKQIQTYYKEHTHPYKTGQVACVVKCPKDGKWYRAAVVQQISPDEVDVIFVDYGYRERVVLNDLQAILPDFLTLESQAFQCALRNVPLQTDAFNWPEEVCRHFKDFISASVGPLTCTVYALVLSSSSLCNIVDLQTPFVGAEEFLRECGLNHSDCIELQKLVPLGSLYSFFYSTFNIKIGSEEEIYITHIHSFSKFYCQLNRNTETIEALMKKVSEMSKLADHTKCYTSNMRLCIARYFEDGLFYRALVSPMKSTSYLYADFVDFGNKQMTERDQVMPLPDSATDLIFTPMQAIKCRLSDFREKNVPAGVIRWFEETFLGKLLRAVIVSRESNGQIVVELYDEQLQVGQKIEEKILEELAVVTDYTERYAGNHEVAHHVEVDKEVKEGNAKNHGRIELETKLVRQVRNYCRTDAEQHFGDEEQADGSTHDLHSESSSPLSSEDSEEPLFRETVCTVLERREKHLDGKPASLSQCYPSDLNGIAINAPSESCTKQPTSTGQQEKSNENVSELTSLPPRDIQMNSEVEVYISHINNPSSFYIQFVEDENLIIQLEEELNESVVNSHRESGLDELRVGDLILAEHAADSFYYRAVIKALKSGNSYEVEFIDYGNTAVVSPSKICGIQRKLLTFPRLSTHCFLSKVKTSDESWTDEGTSYFLSKINGKPVTCKFTERHGEQWEVEIICDGKSLSYDLQQRKGKAGLQNKPVHDWESMPKQIQVTNESAQGGKSMNGLGDQGENCAVNMKNTFETHIDIPPQDLSSGQVERAEVMNVSVDGEFNVQLVRNLQILNDLNVMLVKEAQVSGLLTVESIEEGLECMTKSERNLKWYRSKVIKMFIREKLMLVYFIDYGNCEVVSLNNAKSLSNEMKRIPKQAVFCEWVWFKELNIPFVPIVNALLSREIRILFLRYLESSHIWEVEILIGEFLLIEYLDQPSSLCQTIGLEKSGNVDCKEFAKSVRLNSVTWIPLQSDGRYPGFATMVTDPSNFCVQFEDTFDCMKKLTLLLSDIPENLPALPEESVAPGTSCLIQFGVEAQWNRAEISEVTSQSVVLTFIDYGFLKSIPYSAIHKLKVIPEALSYLPRLAYSCSLHGMLPAAGEYWSSEAKLLFQELLGKPGLIFHFNHYGSGMRLEVDVLYGESNLAHSLVAAGHAVYSTSGCSLTPLDRNESAKLHLQPNTNSNCSRSCELDCN